MLIRAKSLINQTAEELNVSTELVKDIVDFYYSELRIKMETLSHTRIRVRGLGVFYTSKNKLSKSIETLEYLTKTTKPTTFTEIGIENHRKRLIEHQKNVLKRIIKEQNEHESKKNLER